MERVNKFEVKPRSPKDRELLLELLDASAVLWNEETYERRQQFFGCNSVWNTTDYRDRYKGGTMQSKVAVTVSEIKGCVGVSRWYAYDLIDAMTSEINGVRLREARQVETGPA